MAETVMHSKDCAALCRVEKVKWILEIGNGNRLVKTKYSLLWINYYVLFLYYIFSFKLLTKSTEVTEFTNPQTFLSLFSFLD